MTTTKKTINYKDIKSAAFCLKSLTILTLLPDDNLLWSLGPSEDNTCLL